MPFPLAHPAAVLPLRRFCPHPLNFPALVVGSLTPDLGYLFDALGYGKISHHALGLFTFALPVGAILLGTIWGAGRALRTAGPEPLRCALAALFDPPLGNALTVALSLLLGALTHLCWDSFTHQQGWLTERVGFLHCVLGQTRGGIIMTCDVLWYGSTLIGVTCLAHAYRAWRASIASPSGSALPPSRISHALLAGSLALPASLAHRMAQSLSWDAAVGGITALAGLLFVWRTEALALRNHVGIPRDNYQE